LLYASRTLEALKADCENFDQQHGIDIIARALRTPITAICKNAGVEGAVIVGKLLEMNDVEMGYNAYNNEIVNMKEAGIIDPTKVVRTALVDAASIASLMITTEAAIVDVPTEKGGAGGMGGGMGGMGGGMGGMGGMM
jgi:chaperonin GroEL